MGVALCACSATPPELPPGGQLCGEPRPQMCTREYRPACGHRCARPPCEPEERKTYGNACTACADPQVHFTTPGPCQREDGEAAPGEGPVLQTCCDRGGRKKLAEQSGLSESQLLKWANMADLFRIQGVPEF